MNVDKSRYLKNKLEVQLHRSLNKVTSHNQHEAPDDKAVLLYKALNVDIKNK
jgi:hypothetical protein